MICYCIRISKLCKTSFINFSLSKDAYRRRSGLESLFYTALPPARLRTIDERHHVFHRLNAFDPLRHYLFQVHCQISHDIEMFGGIVYLGER